MQPGPKIEREAAKLDKGFGTGLFAALLGLLITVTFFPVIAGFETFSYGDSETFANPVAFYHRTAFWQGQMPLWNPLNSCGIPFLAQWNSMTLYPPSLIYLLLPFPWSFGIFRLAHLFLGGMGMFVLARRWAGSSLGAAVAGTVFSFNGLTWYGLMWPHIIAGLAWMPWVILAADNIFRLDAGCGAPNAVSKSQGRPPILDRGVSIATLAGGMQMLSGGVEVIIQTWLIILTIWFFHFARGNSHRWRLVLRGVAMPLFTSGLAAVQLLPFLDLLRHSQRQSGYGSSTMGAMPAMGWANYLVPVFRETPGPCGVCAQDDQSWTGSYYLGVGVVALAGLAVWRVRRGKVWLLAGIALFGLLMAMGGHGFFYEAVRRIIPWLGFMRFPVKFVVLVTFCLPLLAAFGVNQMLQPQVAARSMERRCGIMLGGVLAGVMAFIIWWSWRYPLAGNSSVAVAANAGVRVLFLGLALTVLAAPPQPSRARQNLFSAVLVLLFWLDIYTHLPDSSPTSNLSVQQAGIIRENFHWPDSLRAGGSRVMVGKEALWKMVAAGSPNPNTDVLGRRLAQFMDVNLLDDVPKVDGFYSVDLNEHLELFKRLYFTTNDAVALKDFLGVSLVSGPSNAMAWQDRPGALPLITTGQRPFFVSRNGALDILFSERFRPLENVYLPPEAKEFVKAAQSRSKVLSTEWTANQVRAKIQADATAMVVVAQNYYHPWTASVDGIPTRLWQANYAFQALEVPAGTHEISLVYKDRALLQGAMISLVTLAITLAMLFWKFPKRPDPIVSAKS